MDTGLTAHAIRYLKIEAGVRKYDAQKAWERANRHRPARPGPLTLAEHQRNLRDPPDTPVKVMAEELVILARHHPVLLHRFLLGAVERRQAAAMDANEMRTPSVLSSLAGFHPPLRLGKKQPSRSSSAMPRRSTLALTAGLSVSHSLTTFTSRVAKWTLTVRSGNRKNVFPVRRARCSSSSFTYERRVLKRVVGSDTMAERRKKRKYNKKKGKGKGKEQAVEPAAAAASSFDSSSSSSSSSAASACATDHHDHGDNDHGDDDDDPPTPGTNPPPPFF